MSENNTILKQRGQKLKQMESQLMTNKEPIQPQPIQPTEPIPQPDPVQKVEKIKKPRKPKTPAQMEAFKKVVEKRQEIIRQNKLDKKLEASKFLLEHEATTKSKPKPTKTVNVVNTESDEDSQPEIIIKKIPKKKKKPIIINVEESESESEAEEEVKPIKKEVPQPTRQLVSQQNKKSLFQMVPTKNYFAD
jgi:hypothetical protein